MENANTGKKGTGGGTKTIKNGSTQVIYNKNNKKTTNKAGGKTQKKSSMNRNSGGIRIGHDVNDDGWRCKICSFMNEKETDVCTMCDSQKGEERPKH